MVSPLFLLKSRGYGQSTAAGYTASFTASSIENGAVEDVLIGRVTVPGWSGSISVALTSTFSGLIKVADTNGIYTGAVATNGQGTLAIAGTVSLTGTTIVLPFSDTLTIISPAFSAVPFGTTAFGSWAPTVPADLGLTTQGTSDQVGYTEPPIVCWASSPMFDTVTAGTTYYAGVRAVKEPTLADLRLGRWHGIKEVYFGADDPGVLANWLKVSDPANHPTFGNNCHICPVNASDKSTSGKSEIRAIVVPWVGVPYVMQGLPDPTTQSTNGSPRTNYLRTSWSLQLNIDKTGTALPHGVVYLNTTTGSDSNDGLSAGAPVKTWEVAVTKIKAQHAAQGFDGTDAGGGTIYMTAGLDQFYGTVVEEAPIPCANLPLTVTRAPGLTRSQVKITSSNNWGLKAEKGVLKGVEKSCQINNYGTANGPTTNYMSFRFHDVYHHGGDALDIYGQTAGAAFCAVGNGFNEAFDVEVWNTRSANFTRFTHMQNVLVDNHSEDEDICNNPKGVIGFEVRNFIDLIDGQGSGNHADVIQFLTGQGQCLIEDLVAVTNVSSQQVIFSTASSASRYQDIAFIRPRMNNSPYSGNAFILSSTWPIRNFVVYDPQITGGYSGWTNNVQALSTNVSFIMETGSTWTAALTSVNYRYGRRVIYPETLVEPDTAAPVDDHFTTTYGTSLLDYVNADVPASIDRTVATTNVIQAVNCDIGVGNWLPTTGKGVPTYNANGIRTGVATVEFNGDNSTTSSGAQIGKSSSSAIGGNNPVERWLIVSQQELAAQTTSRFVAVYGLTAAASRALVRAVSGGVNKLVWEIGVGSGVVSLTAPGDFSGVCIIHAYYNPTDQSYGVGLWNAASPNYAEGNYTRGTVVGTVNTSATRTALGGAVATAGGSQGTWWNGGVNRSAILTRNATEVERAASHAFLKAIAGI